MIRAFVIEPTKIKKNSRLSFTDRLSENLQMTGLSLNNFVEIATELIYKDTRKTLIW
jgi:hypothetical protein